MLTNFWPKCLFIIKIFDPVGWTCVRLCCFSGIPWIRLKFHKICLAKIIPIIDSLHGVVVLIIFMPMLVQFR